MKQLRYFVLGICSVLFLAPVCDKLLELVTLWIEVLKIKPSKDILNYQKDTQVIKEFLKPVRPIYDVCDDDDFEDFDDMDE